MCLLAGTLCFTNSTDLGVTFDAQDYWNEWLESCFGTAALLWELTGVLHISLLAVM